MATAIFVGKPWTCVADCWRNLLIPVVNQPALIFDLWRARAWVNSNASHQQRQQQQDIEFDPHFHSILFRIRGDFLMHSERLHSKLGLRLAGHNRRRHIPKRSTPKRSVYKIPRNYFLRLSRVSRFESQAINFMNFQFLLSPLTIASHDTERPLRTPQCGFCCFLLFSSSRSALYSFWIESGFTFHSLSHNIPQNKDSESALACLDRSIGNHFRFPS